MGNEGRRLAPVLMVACLLSAGCEQTLRPLPETDQRIQFLGQYCPNLKTLYYRIGFQIATCSENLKTLQRMRSSFDQEEARELVSAKIKELEAQRLDLKRQLNRIHVEAEKGIAYQRFSVIDGGGTRLPSLQKLAKDCEASLRRVRESAAGQAREGGSDADEVSPPKVLPVWPVRTVNAN
jgi:hypothetical protein